MHALLSFKLIAFALLLLPASAIYALDFDKQQTWESADGREIVASIVSLDAATQTAKLRRSDGLVFTIAFDQFAEADAERLQKAADDLQQTDPSPKINEVENKEPVELPEKFELKEVPMVKQKGNFCVPASATMIAGYHSIETDQDQIAFLSSSGSFNNQGTYPRDMLLAMEKLGFDGQSIYWENNNGFFNNVLPVIRRALVEKGPIYISFKAGVFGDSGHGCVIIGYHHRREKLFFHNPWGNVFEKEYEEVATQAQGIVIIEAPKPAPIASEAYIERIRKIIPKFEDDLFGLVRRLQGSGQAHQLVWCSRHDAREDERFAVDTARDDGRKILDLAFHRNPAVIIPRNNDGSTEKFLFVTRAPEGGASFMLREISADGWSEPELVTLGSLTRTWPTKIEAGIPRKIIWELPMIELHPDD